MRVEVSRHDNPDPKKSLHREVWAFDRSDWAPGLRMRLIDYRVETRRSTRCRTWEVESVWPKTGTIKAKVLPQPESIPDDVIAEVKQRLFDAFSVEIGWPK